VQDRHFGRKAFSFGMLTSPEPVVTLIPSLVHSTDFTSARSVSESASRISTPGQGTTIVCTSSRLIWCSLRSSTTDFPSHGLTTTATFPVFTA